MTTSSNDVTMAPAANNSNSALEARLSERLEGVLEDIGQAYNQVEERVHVLESTSPTYIKRLGKLEESTRPYEKYGKKVQEAVSQLDVLKKNIEALKSGSFKELEKKLRFLSDRVTKSTEGLSKRIDEIRPMDFTQIDKRIQEHAAGFMTQNDDINSKLEGLAAELTVKTSDMTKRLDDLPISDHRQADINASVQTLLSRVLTLEGQTQSSTTEETPLSTNELANTLIARLARGDFIDSGTLARLRETMPIAASPGPIQAVAAQAAYLSPGSPVSTSERLSAEKQYAPQRKRALEHSNENGDDETATQNKTRPRKRARADVRKSLRSEQTTQNDRDGAEEPSSLGTRNEVENGEEADGPESTPEIRRSTRTPKPNKKHSSFLTWIEVRERRKTR